MTWKQLEEVKDAAAKKGLSIAYEWLTCRICEIGEDNITEKTIFEGDELSAVIFLIGYKSKQIKNEVIE